MAIFNSKLLVHQWFYPSHTPKVKDSLLADASAALDRLEEILGGDRPPEAPPEAPAVPEAVALEAVPKGSPGFNLERETHDSQERDQVPGDSHTHDGSMVLVEKC